MLGAIFVLPARPKEHEMRHARMVLAHFLLAHVVTVVVPRDVRELTARGYPRYRQAIAEAVLKEMQDELQQ